MLDSRIELSVTDRCGWGGGKLAVTFIQDCVECISLRREYSRATTAHIALEGKLRIAALAHDRERVDTLSPQVESAAVSRAAAREAMKAHEQIAHSASGAEEA